MRMLGAHVTVVAPRTLLPHRSTRLPSTERSTTSIGDVDVLYLLRMQQERMSEALVPNLREYTTRFGLTAERAARLGPHDPGHAPRADEPRRRDHGRSRRTARRVITQQVTNGIAVRMAVLFDLLGSGSTVATADDDAKD